MLPESIGNLVKLETLDIQVRNIKALPLNIGKLPAIKELYIKCGSIPKIPSDITGLKNLKEIIIEKAYKYNAFDAECESQFMLEEYARR
jgi:Leucine-rich repeat (LRR) protein